MVGYIVSGLAFVLPLLRFAMNRKRVKINVLFSYFLYYYLLFYSVNEALTKWLFLNKQISKVSQKGQLILIISGCILAFISIGVFPLLSRWMKKRKNLAKICSFLEDVHEAVIGNFFLFAILSQALVLWIFYDQRGYFFALIFAFLCGIITVAMGQKKKVVSKIKITEYVNTAGFIFLPILGSYFSVDSFYNQIFKMLVIIAGLAVVLGVLEFFRLLAVQDGGLYSILNTSMDKISAEKISVKKLWKKCTLYILPVTFLCFQFILQNSIEFYYVNMGDLSFSLGDFLINALIIFITTVICVGLFLNLFKTKILRYISGFIVSVGIAGYIQVMIFNKDIGMTDVADINWKSYSGKMVANSLFWVLTLCVIMILVKKYKDKILKCLSWVTGALLIMVLSASISIVMKIGKINNEPGVSVIGYYMSGEKEYELSSKQNVVVFFLDTFSNDYLDAMLKKYPEQLSDFKDFTYFDNYDPRYDGTALAMNYLLSGGDFDASVSCKTSSINAFSSEKSQEFYGTLENAGYSCRLYTDMGTFSVLSGQNLYGKYDNVKYEENTPIYKDFLGILKNTFRGSAYKMLPLALKQFDVVVTSDFDGLVQADNPDSNIEIDESFEHTISNSSIYTGEEDGVLDIYHFRGMHDFGALADVTSSGQLDMLQDRAKYNMEMVAEYMEQLKKLGIYDNTVIIISADHGVHETINGIQPIFFIKGINEKHDKVATNSAPVSAEEFMSTIIYSVGLDNKNLGKTVYDFDEGEKRERSVYVRKNIGNNFTLSNETLPYNYLYKYTYSGDKEVLRGMDEDEPTKKIKLKDFW